MCGDRWIFLCSCECKAVLMVHEDAVTSSALAQIGFLYLKELGRACAWLKIVLNKILYCRCLQMKSMGNYLPHLHPKFPNHESIY